MQCQIEESSDRVHTYDIIRDGVLDMMNNRTDI